ncbi:unnamed protein product [Brachionus calyciflorus]|uniref:HTH CENPB-type domain-containing protein n=1 Tax=Brachionus calyciflorus TaxID=104777 RepID=A0A813WR49_9BILA|nr:unnamed protein product [Brachionus calyciflorus]
MAMILSGLKYMEKKRKPLITIIQEIKKASNSTNKKVHQKLNWDSDSDEENEKLDILTEIKGYLANDNNYDDMSLWKLKQVEFPILSSLASVILAAQATSYPSERLFSLAGYQLWDRRNQTENLKKSDTNIIKYESKNKSPEKEVDNEVKLGDKPQSDPNQLPDNSNSALRVSGGGRKPFYPELEQAICEWLVQGRRDKKVINYLGIKRKAKQIFKELYPGMNPTKASSRWILGFAKRYSLSYRKSTHKSQHTNKLFDEERLVIVDYLCKISSLIKQYKSEYVINMDETPIYFDMN